MGQLIGALDAVEVERRLTGLEYGQASLEGRLTRVEDFRGEMARRDMDRAQALAKIQTQVARLVKDFDKLSGDQQRFIIGAALSIGGVLVGIFRAKIGL